MASSGVRQPSAASVVRLHSSIPSQPRRVVELRPAVREDDPAREAGHEHAPAARERMGREPQPSGVAHRGRDLERRAPVVGDLLVDAEREVMTLLGADLGADQDAYPVVAALPAVAPGGERVVIGQQHSIGAGRRGRRDDLPDAGRAVRVRAVYVDHARHVDELLLLLHVAHDGHTRARRPPLPSIPRRSAASPRWCRCSSR
jgi:hypothetical protein